MTSRREITSSKAPTATETPASLTLTSASFIAVQTEDIDQLVSLKDKVKVFHPVDFTVPEILAIMPSDFTMMTVKGRGMIVGVSASSILREFMAQLISARRTGNPVPLIYCGVLAVAVAYTVSREWVGEYDAIPAPHLFSPFEIVGRKAIAANGTSDSIDWVGKSNMNAAALRVLGSMIVESGGGSAFLSNLKKEAGTMFEPPTGTKARDIIMKEAAKDVSEADKEALAIFKKFTAKYAMVVGSAFGAGSVDVKSYELVAATLGVVII